MGAIDYQGLNLLSYGMYVVSSFRQGKINGQIADVVMQVGLEPLLVVACLNRQNFTAELIRESKKFSVSILSQEAPLPFIGRFGFRSGRDFDKFDASVRHRVLESGDPVLLDHAVGYLDLVVEQEIELPTHILFIGRVVETAVLDKDKEPMTYAYYRAVKGGLTQKNAPTYNKQ